MDDFFDDLVANVIANLTSKWACAPLLVPKPGAQFRFTVDLQPVNIFTFRRHYPTSSQETELSGLKDAQFLANFDMCHSNRKLLLPLWSQECQSFITPDAIFMPTRMLHCTTNTIAHLQSF